MSLPSLPTSVQNAIKDFVHEGLVHYEYDDKGVQALTRSDKLTQAAGNATRLPPARSAAQARHARPAGCAVRPLPAALGSPA